MIDQPCVSVYVWTLIITKETFKNYVEIDKDVTIPSILTDDDITDSVCGIADINYAKKKNIIETSPRVSVKQAKAALIC